MVFGTDKSVPYNIHTLLVGNAFMHSAKNKIWQSSYHDHIIRNQDDYFNIWKYIDTNVLRWDMDCFFT